MLKVIEVLSSSTESWEKAAQNGISEASKTLKGITSAYVQDMSTTVKNGTIEEFRVNLKITFALVR